MREPGRMSEARKRKLGRICQAELARAEGGGNDELQANRTLAMRYYRCEPRGDELEGRSRVISSDVNDMVNHTLSMLVPMLSTDCVVEFEPRDEADEQAAKAESDAVNQVVIEDNQGFVRIQEAVKDALLMRNGCLRIVTADRETVEAVDLSGADPLEIAAFADQLGPEAELEDQGDGRFHVKQVRTAFEISAVPIENISYQAGFSGPLEKIRFFAERLELTRSDLVEMGISRSVADRLPSRSDALNATARARNVSISEADDAETRDQDRIDCHQCYVRVDLDGDGISERYRVLVAGDGQCLEYELADLIPYALGSPFVTPHRLTGESLFDHLKQTQDVKTAYQRQLIDNVTTINNGRVAFDPARVSEDDVMNPRAGGGIRARDMSAIMALPVPDVTSGILTALGYEDQRRSERGGASLDLNAADAQLVGETAHGIERQYASREALAAMMGRNLAETLIRRIYLLTHEFMRRYASELVTVRINGQAQQMDPRTWPQRNRVNVKVGMSPGERGHLQAVLGQHIQLQAQALAAGANGVLASAETVYRTTMDWLRMAGVDNPERLVVDPASPSAQEAAQAQAQQAQAQQEQQMAMLDRQLRIEETKLRIDLQKHHGELRHKYYDTDAEVAVAEARIAGQGAIDLEKQRLANEVQRETGRSGGAGEGATGNRGAGGGT